MKHPTATATWINADTQIFTICVVPADAGYIACLDDDSSVQATGASVYEAMIALIGLLQAEDATEG